MEQGVMLGHWGNIAASEHKVETQPSFSWCWPTQLHHNVKRRIHPERSTPEACGLISNGEWILYLTPEKRTEVVVIVKVCDSMWVSIATVILEQWRVLEDARGSPVLRRGNLYNNNTLNTFQLNISRDCIPILIRWPTLYFMMIMLAGKL